MTGFERHAPAMIIFYAACLFMGLTFGAVTFSGGSTVTPEMYGPLVYSVPSIVWAFTQSMLASAGILGVYFRKVWLSAIGGFGLSAMFMFFGVAAIMAGAAGTLLVAMALPSSAIAGMCAAMAFGGANGR